jgi:hypothetical protein
MRGGYRRQDSAGVLGLIALLRRLGDAACIGARARRLARRFACVRSWPAVSHPVTAPKLPVRARMAEIDTGWLGAGFRFPRRIAHDSF